MLARLSQRFAFIFGMGLAAAACTAAAADYPSRELRFIVPFAAGSITDVSARYYAQKLSGLAGQPVVVENRPGANGLIGVAAVRSAPADGHTILIGTTSTLATNVALYRKLPYDPLTDFAPLGIMSVVPSVLVTYRDSPYQTLGELIDAARQKPGRLNYAAGATSYQLMGELFNEKAGVKTAFIPYKGSSEALNAVLGKVVDFSILDQSTAQTSIKAGSLRALAVASAQPTSALPEVPTFAQAGIPDYNASTWVAAVVTAATPADELARLQEWFATIARDEDTKTFLAQIGAEGAAPGAEPLRALQRDNIELWKRVARTAGIELQ